LGPTPGRICTYPFHDLSDLDVLTTRHSFVWGFTMAHVFYTGVFPKLTLFFLFSISYSQCLTYNHWTWRASHLLALMLMIIVVICYSGCVNSGTYLKVKISETFAICQFHVQIDFRCSGVTRGLLAKGWRSFVLEILLSAIGSIDHHKTG
jgi:hypothetical protein